MQLIRDAMAIGSATFGAITLADLKAMPVSLYDETVREHNERVRKAADKGGEETIDA